MTHVEVAAAIVVAAFLCLVVVYLALVTARKRQLLSRPGVIPLALRSGGEPWTLGVGRYEGDELWWYSAFGIAHRPSRTMHRGGVSVLGQRAVRADEEQLGPGTVIVECSDRGVEVSLAFPAGAVTGFLSWLESSAPH
jgi:hypothetical protein